MQRDMDLVREILIVVEDAQWGTVTPANLPDHDPAVVAYHIGLMVEAGLIEGQAVRAMDAGPVNGHIDQLTWTGHEFLAAVRNETIWSKVKQKAGSASFDVLMAMAVALAKEKIGLQ